MAESDGSLVPERILELSERLSSVAGAKIGEISSINREAKMLAINALITAARASLAAPAPGSAVLRVCRRRLWKARHKA